MWWKKYKWKIIVPVAVVLVLAAAFWYGGDAPIYNQQCCGGKPIDISQNYVSINPSSIIRASFVQFHIMFGTRPGSWESLESAPGTEERGAPRNAAIPHVETAL